MTITATDDGLVIEDEDVEIRAWDGLVDLGVGTRAWDHPGVTVNVRDGASAYVQAGAEVKQTHAGQATDTVVTAWLRNTTPPQSARVIDDNAMAVNHREPSS